MIDSWSIFHAEDNTVNRFSPTGSHLKVDTEQLLVLRNGSGRVDLHTYLCIE